MALRVWLPLNGNINNQGLSSIVPSGTPTFLDDGKMGKCISLTPKVSFTGLPRLDNFTILFWLKVDSCSSDWADSLGFTSKQADGSSAAPFRFEATKTSRACSFHNNTPYAITQGSRILITNEQKGEWHHCGFSYDGEHCYTYVDGKLIYMDTGLGGYLIDYFYIGETNNMVGGMNDLRIYDECLSQKQIKEISKGLIAHYQLKTPRAIDNLNRGKNYGVYNNFSSSGSTCTVVKTGETYNGADVWRMTYTPNDTSLSSVQSTLHGHGVISPGMKFLANTKYCYWTLFKPISHPDTVVGGVASNIGYWTEIPMQEYGGGWYIVGQKRIGNAPEDRSDSIFTSFKTPSATSGTPIIIDFCCPHLVEGYDYILEEFDYIGTSPTYEIDSSGNGYNGTVTGTISYNPDSARYSGSTQFGGTCADYIYRPIFDFLASPFTFNCWVYQTSATSPSSGNTGNTLQMIVGQGRDCGLAGFELCSANGYARLYLGTQTNGTYYTINDNTTNLLNNWHMITGTFDGTVAKLYVDGTLKGTKESSVEPSWGQATGFVIGKMSYCYSNQPTAYFPFAGSISDVRIYATALSANDIKELYQTSGIIDNNGNIYVHEFEDIAENMAWRVNNSIIDKKWENGLTKVTQANVSCTLTDEGIRVVRTPNVASADHNMWGGFCWRLRSDPLKDILTKGHKYIILYDVKGRTNQGQFTGWDNNMGWGGGGLMPQPTNVVYSAIPVNFNNDEWTTFFYKWDLTDDVYKVCTKSYSSFVEGTVYLSYSDFQVGWNYGDTGEWGTDVYIRNFRLYDITDIDNPKLLKNGVAKAGDINEIGDKIKIRQIGYDANSFIEI